MGGENKKQVDYKLFFAVFLLIIFGMIMISSVSVYSSFRVTSVMEKNGLIDSAYNHFYVLRNITHVIISMIILGIVVKVPYQFFERNARYFLFGSIFLLIVVLFMGATWNGAKGWIDLPFLPFAIQPTEFLKFSMIIYLAYFFKRYQQKLHTFSDGFLPFSLTLGMLVLLVGLQPDFGTILTIVPIALIMFFVAGANVKYIFGIMALGFLLAISVYSIGDYDKKTGKNLNTLGYITQRIDNFMSENKEAIKNKTINYQTEQALIAIGSGGFAGLGFGGSVQKFGYLPEVQGDFIFSVIVEELGFMGALLLLMVYLYIGYRGMLIARHSSDVFCKYVAIGVSSWILLQAFINIGVNLNVVPLTGITLPFVSYGGSSLLALSLGLAVLLNISREVKFSKLDTRGFKRNKFMYMVSKIHD